MKTGFALVCVGLLACARNGAAFTVARSAAAGRSGRPLMVTIDDSGVGAAETSAPQEELSLAERIALEVDAPLEQQHWTPPVEHVAGEAAVASDPIEELFRQDKRPVILFDGVCVFCDAGVQFIMENEAPTEAKEGLFRYATQQSEVGQMIIDRYAATEDLTSSIVLLEKDGFFLRSDAVLRIVQQLRLPWSLLSAAAILAPAAREGIYHAVSEHRHMFGEKEYCMIPDDDIMDKFLQ